MTSKLLSITLSLIIFFATLLILYLAKEIIIPVVFSILIVYVIVGGSRLLQSVSIFGRRLPSMWAYALSITSLIAFFLGTAFAIFNYLGQAISVAPTYFNKMLQSMQSVMAFFGNDSELTWSVLFNELLNNINLQSTVSMLLNSVASIIASAIMIGLLTAFLFIEKFKLPAKLTAMTQNEQQFNKAMDFLKRVSTRVGTYLALKTLLSVIVGVLSGLVMWIMGLELAMFWAALTVVLNYIPYLGSIISVLLPVSFAIFKFSDPTYVLILLLLLVLLQFVIGNLLDPYLMGNSLNLSPFAILLSLMIWGALWGMPGAFLAVPCTACINIILSEFSGTRKIAILLTSNGKLSE